MTTLTSIDPEDDYDMDACPVWGGEETRDGEFRPSRPHSFRLLYPAQEVGLQEASMVARFYCVYCLGVTTAAEIL